MKRSAFIRKIRNKWLHLRSQPIRVFCFHQVSDEFEPDTMEERDWLQTDVFKRFVLDLKKKCTFISLPEMSVLLMHDSFRIKKYAVLTADDGWASIKNVLPWLSEQNIPLTLFINPCYLDGKHYRKRNTEKYLSLKELEDYVIMCNNISVALHGWEHKNMSVYSELMFREDVEKSIQLLSSYPCYIPYYAYPWGKHNSMNDKVLSEYDLHPVLMDGEKNYLKSSFIHRELLMP